MFITKFMIKNQANAIINFKRGSEIAALKELKDEVTPKLEH